MEREERSSDKVETSGSDAALEGALIQGNGVHNFWERIIVPMAA